MKTWEWKNCKACKMRFCRIEGDIARDPNCCKECQGSQYTDAVSSIQLGDRYGKATVARNI